ncbi:MAG: hypothetical protein H0V40_00105 [Actinobacteria bacterium]|nr:hypothetical protein [Actinomycetota bacterium]
MTDCGPTAGDLFHELQGRVRSARAEGEDDALLTHVLALARAEGADEHAWALTALGATLALLGYYDDALQVLRDAIRVQPSAEAKIAALVCAAAIRCDQGEPADALRIGELVETRTGDAGILRLLGRVFLDTGREIGDERLSSQGRRCIERAELEEAFGVA